MVPMVEKAPVNTLVSSPVPRFLAPLAALILVASGCGLIGGSSEEEAPADGSGEPEEFPQLPADFHKILAWT